MHCTTILPSVATYYGPMELCGNLTRLVQFLFLGNVKIGSVSKGINIYYIKILSVEKHVFTNPKKSAVLVQIHIMNDCHLNCYVSKAIKTPLWLTFQMDLVRLQTHLQEETVGNLSLRFKSTEDRNRN